MKRNRLLLLFALAVISFIPLLDLFKPGIPLTHDGQDHVARIANFYQSLAEGNLIPRWAANLDWGYGHPILMFLYPLPSYLASFFHFLGFNFIDATKLVFGFAFVTSGLGMYLWVREFLGEKAAFLAGIFYMLAPYRFVDLYVRGAIGEHVAFIFPPLILYFLLKMSRRFSFWYLMGSSFSLAGLILSHNALSLMFLPLIFAYAIFLLWQIKKDRKLFIIHYSLFIIHGFSLSAFFWFPAFFEGKYTLRDIVTKDNLTGFENFPRLIWSPWNYGGTGSFSVQVGILQWLMVILAPFLIWKFWRKKDKIWLFSLFLFFNFWLAIFLMLPQSIIIYENFFLLQKFQFAWRFLSLAIFPPAVFAGLLVSLFKGKKQILVLLFLSSLVLWFNKDFWYAQSFLQKPESFYTGIYEGTTDTGESSPRWSVRFMEKRPKAKIEVVEGEAQIEEIKRTTTQHQYKIIASQRSRILENTLYFPGWEIMVYPEQSRRIDNKKVEVEFQDPNYRGLQTFWIEPGTHEVLVRFGETRLRELADIISLLAILALFIPFVLQRRLKKLGDGLL